MQEQSSTPSPSNENAAMQTRPRSSALMALAVFVGGAAIFGIGRAYSRAQQLEQSAWALVLVPTLILGFMILRRLRWWLVVLLPVAFMGTIYLAVIFEVAAQPTVNSLTGRTSSCNEARTFVRGLASISLDIGAWQVEFDESLRDGPSPYAQWAEDWRGIGDQYKNLPRMPGAEEYLDFSEQAAEYYSRGFERFAVDDGYGGRTLLQEGDRTREEAHDYYNEITVPSCAWPEE